MGGGILVFLRSQLVEMLGNQPDCLYYSTPLGRQYKHVTPKLFYQPEEQLGGHPFRKVAAGGNLYEGERYFTLDGSSVEDDQDYYVSVLDLGIRATR